MKSPSLWPLAFVLSIPAAVLGAAVAGIQAVPWLVPEAIVWAAARGALVGAMWGLGSASLIWVVRLIVR